MESAKRMEKKAGGVCNRMRSLTRRVIAIEYAVAAQRSESVSGDTGNCCDSRGKF